MTNIYTDFIDAFLEFDEIGRSNVGYDEEKFVNLCQLLKKLESSIRETNSVPIEVANIFVNLYGAIEDSSHRHTGLISEKLKLAASELENIALSITSTD